MSNSVSFFGACFNWCQNGEKVKKINSKTNCMVIFNCCMGYHLGFSTIYFLPARQSWSPWRIWGISTVLYMMSSVPPLILSCHLSVFSNREVMEYWDDSWWWSYYGETISLQRFHLGVGVNFIVGLDSPPVKTFVGAYIFHHGTILGGELIKNN